MQSQKASNDHHHSMIKKQDIIILLLVIMILLLGVNMLSKTSTQQIQQLIQQQEIDKLGGQENYNRAQQIYQSPNYQREQKFIREQKHKIYVQGISTNDEQ